MGAAVQITRKEMMTAELRAAAVRETDSLVVRGILAIALVLEGANRTLTSSIVLYPTIKLSIPSCDLAILSLRTGSLARAIILSQIGRVVVMFGRAITTPSCNML